MPEFVVKIKWNDDAMHFLDVRQYKILKWYYYEPFAN